MKLLLSGEGPTDLGTTRPGEEGLEFVPGPMALIVDKLLEQYIGYSLLEVDECGGDCVRLLSETELAALAKPNSPLFPGLKYGKGNVFYTRNAQVLGMEAKREGGQVVAVLFRDGDGTRSVPHGDWRAKVDSIERGFQLAEFEAGVPMVPRPKSEAWLLCALKLQPYEHCEALEDAPGNDSSPNSLKKRLDARVGQESTAVEQADWIKTGAIDPLQINMSSFDLFRSALERACKCVLAAD